jgi:hypothetical protein
MLNYATLKPGEKITFKKGKGRSYDLLKKEIDGTFGVTQIEELDCWYDDEFLLKEEPAIPVLIIKNRPEPQITDWDIVLCGNIMFASSDSEGNTVSLTEEALKVMSKFRMAFVGLNPVWVYNNYAVRGVRA